MVRGSGLLLLAASVGCSAQGILPPLPSPGQSAVLVVEGSGLPRLRALDLGPARSGPAVSLEPGTRVFSVLYPTLLEGVGLRAGALEIVAPGADPSARPITQEGTVYVFDGGGDWQPALDEDRARLGELWVVRRNPGCLCQTIVSTTLTTCAASTCEAPVITAPDPPVPPDPPQMAPCPIGWAERALGPGEIVCSPPIAQACGAGAAQFLGEAACGELEVCPTASFASASPPVLHVDSAAPSGGDGSLLSPFTSIEDALAVAASGTTVLLSAGAHRGAIAIPSGATIRGLCPRLTRLDPVGPIGAAATGGGLAGVTVGGGIQIEAAGELRLERVIVEGGPIMVLGQAELSKVAIRGAAGAALVVQGQALADGLVIEGSAGAAIEVQAGALLDAFDLWARNGSGVFIEGGTVTGARWSIEGATTEGIRIAAGRLDLDDLILVGGTTLLRIDGGDVELDRAWLRSGVDANLSITGTSTTVVRDLISTDAVGHPGEDEPMGYGLEVVGPGTLELSRGLVGRSHELDFRIGAGASTVVAKDLIVRSPGPVARAPAGLVHRGRSLTLERASIEGHQGTSLTLVGPVTISDLAVRDVGFLDGQADQYGNGIDFRTCQAATLERVVIDGAAGYAMSVGLYTRSAPEPAEPLRFTDVDVKQSAQGLSLHCPEIGVERLAVTGATYEGVEVGNGAGAAERVELTDLLVQSSGFNSAKNAAVLFERTKVRVVRGLIARSGVGLLLRGEPEVMLDEVMVLESTVGAKVSPMYPHVDALAPLLLKANVTPLTVIEEP